MSTRARPSKRKRAGLDIAPADWRPVVLVGVVAALMAVVVAETGSVGQAWTVAAVLALLGPRPWGRR